MMTGYTNVDGIKERKNKKKDNLACSEGEEVEKDFQHVSLDQNVRVL